MSQPSQSKDTPHNQAHTPGPWGVSSTGTDVLTRLTRAGGQVIAVMTNRPHAEAAANARLMATAPELLEALKTCVTHIRAMTHDFDDPEDEAPELVAADALIAKAEGRQP